MHLFQLTAAQYFPFVYFHFVLLSFKEIKSLIQLTIFCKAWLHREITSMMEAAGMRGHKTRTHNTSTKKHKQLFQKRLWSGHHVSCEEISHHAVSRCSLRKLCDACLQETLAAFLCECQLLLCCTSRRSPGDWCEPVLCPARVLWFLSRLQRESNQSSSENLTNGLNTGTHPLFPCRSITKAWHFQG